MPRPYVPSVQAELEIVRKFYAHTPMTLLLEMLPGRNAKWVYNAAMKLCVRRSESLKRHIGWMCSRLNGEDEWQPSEDEELRMKWPALGAKTVIVGRTNSAICKRASTLKLKLDRGIKRIPIDPLWINNAPTKHDAVGDSD